MGSRVSVIPFFLKKKNEGILPITDNRMTRFMISLEEGVKLVWHAFEDMLGGEIYVKKLPSVKIVDLARFIAPEAKLKFIGMRPGEKLHEQMIGESDSFSTYEYKDHFKILPNISPGNLSKYVKNGKQVKEGFSYSSQNNNWWLSEKNFKDWVSKNNHFLES